VQAEKQLPGDLGLVLDRGGRAQHLGLAPRQSEAVKRVGAQARDLLLEQQRVRVAGQQPDGEAPAVALAHERRAWRQREPLGNWRRQPAGMVGRAEVLGKPALGVDAGELDLAGAVEQHDCGARRRLRGERPREAPARLRDTQCVLESRAHDVEHIAVALGELTLAAAEPGDDRLAATGAHADRYLILDSCGVQQVAVELAPRQRSTLDQLRQPQGRPPARRMRCQ
jgi:hypothetical protein